MVQIFLKVLSMSAVGSVVILAVLLGRLLLKKAPRAVTCALWLVVLFRLLCPWSPESRFGGIARTASVSVETRETVTLPTVATQTSSGTAEATRSDVQFSSEASTAEVVQTSPERNISWQEICCGLWILGMGGLAVYSMVSLLRLKRRLVGAVRLRDNIYQADHLETAFVLGWIRPRIYLPSSLSAQEQDYILVHEQTHIRRGDPWWKALAFLALAVHWFNPLVWVAFVSFGRDMETACDEAVVRKLGPEIEADYAASLLRLATGRRIPAGAPLAFGEGDTSGRIRHILRYKKPAFWAVLLAVLAVVILGVFLIFDRTADTGSDYWNARYSVREIRYDAPMYDFTYTDETAPEYAILPDGDLYAIDTEGRNLIYSEDWTYVGKLVEVAMDRQERNALFNPSNNTVQEIMDDVTVVYEAQGQVNGDAQEYEHYLMVTRQGRLYLACGSKEHVRWLFLLEREENEFPVSAMLPKHMDGSLPESIVKELGLTGVNVFQTYEDTDVPGYLLAAWIAGEHMGLTQFHYEAQDGSLVYTNLGSLYDAGGAAAGTRIRFFGPTLGQSSAEKTLFVVLSNNEDLARISCGNVTKQVFSNPSMTVLDAASVEENGLQLLDHQGKFILQDISDGLCVRGTSWTSAIWPDLYPEGAVPEENTLPVVSLPAGRQMLILELDDLDSETLTVTLSQNGGAEDSTVLNRDRDGLFYLFLPKAQTGDTLLCRVIFEDSWYAFRVMLEAEAEPEVHSDAGIDVGISMTGPDPYAELAYDLTDEGPFTLPVSQLTGYSRLFRTNSQKITVSNRSGSASLHVDLLTPESREDFIMLTDVEPGKSVSFTNLTSAQVYALRITGDPDAEVKISD